MEEDLDHPHLAVTARIRKPKTNPVESVIGHAQGGKAVGSFVYARNAESHCMDSLFEP
jgi:hypothetical protein